MDSKLLKDVSAFDCYNVSMRCAIDKALNGSDSEDGYFLEKLEKTANRFGYILVQKCKIEYNKNC